MKPEQIKYAHCVCGRIYPLAHCIPANPKGPDHVRMDRYIAHKNFACVPCLRIAKRRIDYAEKNRALTDDEIEKRALLIAALPQGI